MLYLAGFFFPRPTLIARLYSREDNDTTDMRSAAVTGPRYLGKSLYVLTSRRTFSAAEAAAYHLKYSAKAIMVGETTGGGAHRIRGVDLNDDFTLLLPYTRPINVVTKGDWEGTGVVPEIASGAEQALAVAHAAALRKLVRRPR
jgi:C-terminal processing protease CtpA/Prc